MEKELALCSDKLTAQLKKCGIDHHTVSNPPLEWARMMLREKYKIHIALLVNHLQEGNEPEMWQNFVILRYDNSLSDFACTRDTDQTFATYEAALEEGLEEACNSLDVFIKDWMKY